MVAGTFTGQFDEFAKRRMWGKVPLRMMVFKIRTPLPRLIVLYSKRPNTVVSMSRPPVQEMAESKTRDPRRHSVW